MVFAPRFFLILALAILFALASLWHDLFLAASVTVTSLLLAASVLDLLLTPRSPLRIDRRHPPVLSLGHAGTVELHLRNRSLHRLRFIVQDAPPEPFRTAREPVVVYLNPSSETELTYNITGFQRGEFEFGNIAYRTTGPLGLVLRQEAQPSPARIYVFPDVSSTGARDLALNLNAPALLGRRPRPLAGEGREFESLREYQRDDDYRNIDWKSSARHGRLITRQYQAERDQRLMIAIDLGRLMSPKIGEYRKLDYAINAAVRLTQLALHKGDMVGLTLFSHEIAYYLPPHKGRAQLGSIVQALVSAQPRRLEPNYPLVFNYIARRNTRRTFVVCFTDLLDMNISSSLAGSLTRLRPRHLPMTVTISDSDLAGAIRADAETGMDVYRHIAAQEVWDDYQRTIRSLETNGVLTVNVPAAELTLATLARYLEIKQAGRL